MQTVDFQRLPLKAGASVLDLGCGEGRHSIGLALHAAVSIIGLDLGLKDLRTAAKRYQECRRDWPMLGAATFVHSDGQRLPFADASLDCVICSEVLEHIPDYQQVLAEINRVLKPEGVLAVSVPRRWPEQICWWLSREYHEVEGGHVRIFNSRELRRSIEGFGWQQSARHWAHALHVPYWWLKCLFWKREQRQGETWLTRLYHRFLVWDLMQRPWLTRALDKLLNPLMGKSVVMYFRRSEAGS